MSDSARAISDNNATLTYLIHTCIMQYAQCIGLNPKKVQIRKAKLFEPTFFPCLKMKKTVGKLFRTDINSGNSYCTI